MSYDLGELVPLSVTVKDASGNLANSGSMTVTITLPDQTSESHGVTPASTGVYDYDYASVQAGRHQVRWVATGANSGAFTDVFDVLAAATGQIISLADAKAQLNIDASDTSSDAEVLDFIRSATSICEQYAGIIAQRTCVETFHGGKPHLLLGNQPVLAVTSVVDRGQTLDPSTYEVNTGSGVLTRVAGVYALPFLPGFDSVVVTYTAGMQVVPAHIQQAARIIVQHLWETQRTAGRNAYSGNPDEYDPRYSYSIPRRALELLGPPILGGFA